jgi:photosystem II stability/assembly factor-like uncharacterized protein
VLIRGVILPSASAAADLPTWRPTGPTALGGQVTAVAFAGNGPERFWLGSGGGGLWLSSDFGAHYALRFDASPAIGAIAVDAADPQKILLGSGNASGAPDGCRGHGIYRSGDGGSSWQVLSGTAALEPVAAICFAPLSSSAVVIAVGGGRGATRAVSGSGPPGAIYRSNDGGQSFSSIFLADSTTAFTGVAADPTRSGYWLAATRNRGDAAPLGFSAIYLSRDDGLSWAPLIDGLPAPPLGPIAVAIDRGGWYHALLADTLGTGLLGLYTTPDPDSSWSRSDQAGSLDALFADSPWPSAALIADPADSTILYALGETPYKSNDRGRHWSPTAAGTSGAARALAIHPEEPNRVILGTDTALYRSLAGGLQWIPSSGPAITQIGGVCGSPLDSTVIYAGSSHYGLLRHTAADGWRTPLSGHGGVMRVNPLAPRHVYAALDNHMHHSDDRGLTWSEAESGIVPGEPRATSLPIAIDPLSAATLYTGTDRLYQSIDNATTWQALTPPFLPGAAITAIAVNPSARSVVWVGTEGGGVFATDDGGLSWSSASPPIPTPPADLIVTAIAPDPADQAATHLALAAPSDSAAWLFRTTDLGAHWSSSVTSLPAAPIRALRRHPNHPAWLYLGGDAGVFMSADNGLSWAVAGLGLPPVRVTDLWVEAESELLLAATWGRSTWRVAAREPTVGVDSAPPPAPLRPRAEARLGRAYPNPFNPRLHIPVILGRAQPLRLTIHDLGGRRIRLLHDGFSAAGEHTWVWDGRTDGGLPAPSGVYVVHLHSTTAERNQRLLLLR